MSSERTRIVLIFAAVAVVVGGGGYYWFGVWRPHQVRGAAQTEIAGWESRWAHARTCLLGESPRSSSAAESLAIESMLHGGFGSTGCVTEISGLARGNEVDSGMPTVETAWDQLDQGIHKLAAAFATHVDPSGEHHAVDDPLGGAIDAVDAQVAALRAAADLPIVAPRGGPRLPAATIVNLVNAGDKDPITGFDNALSPASGHGTFAIARTGTYEVQLALVPGAAPKVTAIGAGEERGTPDVSWGAIADSEGIQIGVFGADGRIQAPTKLAITPAALGAAQLLAVVGGPTDGAVVYGAGDHMFVARPKAGVFTASPPIIVDRVITATDAATGTTAIAWNDKTGAMHGMFIQPVTGATAVIELGADQPDTMCVTGDRAWLRTTRSALIAFGATGPASPPVAIADHVLRGCSPDGAIFENRGAAGGYAICGATCRPVDLVSDAVVATTTLGAKLVVFTSGNGIIGVSSETSAPRYFAVPLHFSALRASTDGKVFDVLGHIDTKLAIARFPVN